MATESQFDLWRKDALGNLRKAGEAFQESAVGDPSIPPGAMHTDDRAMFCISAAELTGQIMVSERLGQLVSILTMSGDERFAQQADRIRTGEQILQRIVDTAEKSDLTVEDELMVSITMAEDWLDPESLVNFAPPEAVEQGRDPQSQEFGEEAINGDEEKDYSDHEQREEEDPHDEDLEEADAAEVAEFDEMAEEEPEEPFDRADEDMRESE